MKLSSVILSALCTSPPGATTSGFTRPSSVGPAELNASKSSCFEFNRVTFLFIEILKPGVCERIPNNISTSLRGMVNTGMETPTDASPTMDRNSHARLLTIKTAAAPALCALIAFVVNRHVPRLITTILPVKFPPSVPPHASSGWTCTKLSSTTNDPTEVKAPSTALNRTCFQCSAPSPTRSTCHVGLSRTVDAGEL